MSSVTRGAFVRPILDNEIDRLPEKYSTVTSIAAVLAAMAVLVTIVTAVPETKLDARITVPAERIQAPSKGRPADAARARVSLAGAVVLQDRATARGASVFFSSRDHGYDEGEVRAETVTRVGGVFDLDVPRVDVPWARFVGSGALGVPAGLTRRIDACLSGRPAAWLARTVRAGTRKPDGIRGRGSRRKACSDAMIEPLALDRDATASVPRRLASIIGADTITNARGRAVMTAFFPDELAGIRVTAEGHGQQEFSFNTGTLDAAAKVVKLRPVGRLKGRMAGDPGEVRHSPLTVSSFSPAGERPERSYTRVITTDDSGRFDIPQIAIGRHGVRTVPRFDLPWFAHTDGLVNVEPGKTAEVVLTLKPAIRVRGSFEKRVPRSRLQAFESPWHSPKPA